MHILQGTNKLMHELCYLVNTVKQSQVVRSSFET